jgi:hypothetical protein
MKIRSSLSQATTRAVLFVFFALTGITWVAGETGVGILGRLTLADGWGVLIILLVGISAMKTAGGGIVVPVVLRAFVPLLLVFSLGVLLAAYPLKGLMELVIHIFIFVVAIAIFNMGISDGGNSDRFGSLLYAALLASALIAVVGLLHFLFFPNWLHPSYGGLTGTFRNTGQAGTYFGTYLAIVIPGFLSGRIKARPINLLLLATLLLALIFTVKRAALLGTAIGLALLAIRLCISPSKRDKRIGLGMSACGLLLIPALFLLFQWSLENVPGIQQHIEKKINSGTVEKFSSGFFADNVQVTAEAFVESPLYGVGLGNVGGIISDRYEIHSTYLGIIGYSGVLGVLGYIFFIGVIVKTMIGNKVSRSPYEAYLSYMLPLFIGLIASWGYTYHLRKREFWVLLAFIAMSAWFKRKSGSRRDHPRVVPWTSGGV